MTGLQETNYFKCGDCKSAPTFDINCVELATEGSHVEDLGDWENRPACGDFEGEE